VRADEKLTAFLELESAICAVSKSFSSFKTQAVKSGPTNRPCENSRVYCDAKFFGRNGNRGSGASFPAVRANERRRDLVVEIGSAIAVRHDDPAGLFAGVALELALESGIGGSPRDGAALPTSVTSNADKVWVVYLQA
jgi:hypothetical protein